MSSTKTPTQHHKEVINKDHSMLIYQYLKDTLKWEEVVSRNGKLTMSVTEFIPGEDSFIDQLVTQVLTAMFIKQVTIYGIELEYYCDGNQGKPGHSVFDRRHVVLALGCCRTISLGKRSFSLDSGDIVTFGSPPSRVPRSDCEEGTILFTLTLSK